MIRLTKEFKFEMAHALYGYDGLCANLHGHSYKLLVTVRGGVKNEEGPKKGMVIDFSVLKSIVKSLIINKYDHSLVLNANTLHGNLNLSLFKRVYFMPYQPTSENLVKDFALQIREKLPEDIELYSVILSETATSYAEWNCEDNN